MTSPKPELVFDDLPKGRKFTPLRYEITPRLVNAYMDTVGDRNPLYWDQAKAGAAGGLVAPPGLAAIYARLSYLQENTMPSGGVLAGQEFEFLKPVKPGAVLTVQAEVFESYLDPKDRKRVNFLIVARDGQGDRVCVVRLYAIWPK
ncbi:MAG: MaoC family dehydratase [Proteobacteria bacterium]|nr:MaoC family dehydratase [Pseudomonadota bacterium]MBU1452737.1 MaoC family dehydratase [Pseudomonadota bacterium]MBU2467877.1 MaoC family dehydratase [Pseudomonadota bacterium]MBU2519388.1 MaoC family dehydratase [Pseudomonadota bacterium]